MNVADLSFSYGDKVICGGLSLDLPDSGVTALAGPSGCGKTTLLRLLAGLESPQGGRCCVPPPEEVAFLFQENRLLPGRRARDQVALVLPRTRRGEAARWLDAVGLEGAHDLPPEQLSGGMQRRVALARCLAYGQGKRLLLLDEPFTGVDPRRARELMDLIRAQGIPTVYTAHDAEALALADHVICLAGPPLRLETP